MEELINTLPWSFLDDAGKEHWVRSGYWDGLDGEYTVDTYGDGDHFLIGADELPTREEVEQAWKNYYQFVIDTGTDPLNEFSVPQLCRKARKWQVWFRTSIVGAICIGIRNNGRGEWLDPELVSDDVRRYLHLKKTKTNRWVYSGTIEEFKEVITNNPQVQQQRCHAPNEYKFYCTITEFSPNSKYAKQVAAAARLALHG